MAQRNLAKLLSSVTTLAILASGLISSAPAEAADLKYHLRVHISKILPEVKSTNIFYWGSDGSDSDDSVLATVPTFEFEDGFGAFSNFTVAQTSALTNLSFKIRESLGWSPSSISSRTYSVVVGEPGSLTEVWCNIQDQSCSQVAPNPALEVRVHINKPLSATADWEVYNFGGDTHGAVGTAYPLFNGQDDFGAYSSFKIYQGGDETPNAILNNPEIPPVTNGVGLVVRHATATGYVNDSSDWQQPANFNEQGIAEVWCEVVAAANRGCSATKAPQPTKVTIHINRPLDLVAKYVVWSNQVTAMTDVNLAHTFSASDYYGAIATLEFDEPANKYLKFYITDGRSHNSPKVSGSRDVGLEIVDFKAEVWCDIVSAAPICSTQPPLTTFQMTMHLNRPLPQVANWNVWSYGVGIDSTWRPANGSEEGFHPFQVESPTTSVATWTLQTRMPPTGDWGYAIRDSDTWNENTKTLTGEVDTAALLGNPSVELWCDTKSSLTPASANADGDSIECTQTPTKTIKVHYNMPLAELASWEIAAFGTGVGGDTRVQFSGEDKYGATALIHYNPSVTDVSTMRLAVRKFQPFVAANGKKPKLNLDPWACVDPIADCTGGYFAPTANDSIGLRKIPQGATEVWVMAGSEAISKKRFTTAPTRKIKISAVPLSKGKVQVFASAGAGTTPSWIVITALTASGKNTVPSRKCIIARSKVGATLGASCRVYSLKKGVTYRFKAQGIAYGIGTGKFSTASKPVLVK